MKDKIEKVRKIIGKLSMRELVFLNRILEEEILVKRRKKWKNQ